VKFTVTSVGPVDEAEDVIEVIVAFPGSAALAAGSEKLIAERARTAVMKTRTLRQLREESVDKTATGTPSIAMS
jgi:hypothetical protein